MSAYDHAVSIAVTITVPEGVVLAADSASTVGDPQRGVAKVYDHVTKIAQICVPTTRKAEAGVAAFEGLPIAVAAVGAGAIRGRTVQSLIAEFNLRGKAASSNGHSPGEVARRLFGFMKEQASTPQLAERVQGLQMVVCGYQQDAFFPELWQFRIPEDQEPMPYRQPLAHGRPSFGADWFGHTEPITRFVLGASPVILEDLRNKHQLATEELERLARVGEYAMPFDAMPLQDAIDLAVFLVGLAVGQARFAIGPPVCGGTTDVAVVQPVEGFHWVQKKELSAVPLQPRRA